MCNWIFYAKLSLLMMRVLSVFILFYRGWTVFFVLSDVKDDFVFLNLNVCSLYKPCF